MRYLPIRVIRIAAAGLLLFTLFTTLALGAENDTAVDEDPDAVIHSEWESFRVEEIVTGFKRPWSMEFLPNGDALVTDRDIGKLFLVDVEQGEKTEVAGLPDMLRSGKLSAGLFDVRLHPDYVNNGWVYLCYAIGDADASGLAVNRYKLSGNSLTNEQEIFRASPLLKNKWHFGGRMVLVGEYVYLSVGDGYDHKDLAQDLSNHAGKILRITDQGKIPADNPFAKSPNAKPEIWSLGMRNPQGMALNPATGEVWTSEHGPQGGDEINVMRAAVNYGWPKITYGEEYGGGPIGEGITQHPGLEQPLYYYRPSIAPSDLVFYTGKAFPNWNNSSFTGALALTHLNRLQLSGNKIIHEERLLEGKGWRIRMVQQGPDGKIYFGADDGVIRRLAPTDH